MISVKEMVVALALGSLFFFFAKSIALRFSSEADYRRRRNLWLTLTVVGFLSPSFWLYVLIAAPLLSWAGRKDSNPLALYLILLHVIPPVSVEIPTVGIQHLFAVDNYRLLSFCVLIPAAFRLRRSKDVPGARKMSSMDFALLGYGLLRLILYVPPDLPGGVILHSSPTNVARDALLFLVDVYALFYVTSRLCSNQSRLMESLVTFTLTGVLMALMAIFETARHWLLYTGIAARWSDDPLASFYFMRGDLVRAQGPTGHAIVLGFLLALALGFWLYLRPRVGQFLFARLITPVLGLGLLASQARGPWMGAAAIYFSFAALGPRGMSRLFKACALAALVAGIIGVTPLGDRIVASLPFSGASTDNDSASYRERLATRSWELFTENPFLGDQQVRAKMEDLRQGQGIIDFVNTYAQVALFYGVVGLGLFLIFIFIGAAKAYGRSKAQIDPDIGLLGTDLVANIVGMLLIIATCSFIFGVEKMFYVLGGMSAAYANVVDEARRTRRLA